MESMALDPELDLDEGDLDKLELDVRQMAQKISEYRQTLPDNLRNTLDSVLSPYIPVFPNFDSGSDPLPPSRLPIPETQVVPVVLGAEEQESGEKMMQFKERMSRNAVNIPKVVKRMRECIESIDKLDSLEVVTMHPAFRRRRIN
ncbi:hypothetical protein V5N11_007200 [Cardamine amara subsp. amara]|uniref:Uncharacterized protein n=1 Tax=Cardamine amara subsp. amara TaxID=228776 RepID=A0ABD0ZZE4_CARAN